MRPEEELICRIFEQAAEDYQFLQKRNVPSWHDDSGFYSVKDIEKFFGGKWCGRLLEMINCNLNGRELYRKMMTGYTLQEVPQ